jgi:hypothetical protein
MIVATNLKSNAVGGAEREVAFNRLLATAEPLVDARGMKSDAVTLAMQDQISAF